MASDCDTVPLQFWPSPMADAGTTRMLSVRQAGVGRKRRLTAMAMAFPAALLLLVLDIGPLVSVFVISLTDWRMGAKAPQLVGLQNFADLASDRRFIGSLVNTLWYVAVVGPLSVLLGLCVAILVNEARFGGTFYRAVYFLPVIATLAAAAIAWQMLLHPTSGLFNQALRMVGVEGPNWLKDHAWALPTLALIGVWERVGFNMVFFLAALRDRPGELLEASTMDGAGRPWDQFWLVTYPHLLPMTIFLLVVSTIHAFQAFETVAILTQGGPQKSSQLLLYSIYQEGFVFFRTSYAATITVVFMALLAVLSVLQLRFMQRKGSSQ